MTATMLQEGSEKTQSVGTPTYIVTPEAKRAPSRGVQKKYVLIGVSAVLIVALVLAAIMVGMYMFTEAQKDIVSRFSLQFKGSDGADNDQEVESDPNDNVVMYKVRKPGQSVMVVNDFNRDMQIVKIETDEDTNCYVTPLNRSDAMDPSHIVQAGTDDPNSEDLEDDVMTMSNDPVTDRSFLTKKALNMCSGVSLYWAHKTCGDEEKIVDDKNITHTDGDRSKRRVYPIRPLYNLPGVGGCCKIYWACYVKMYELISFTKDRRRRIHKCRTVYRRNTCCSTSRACGYVLRAKWRTPGLNCG